MQRRVSNAGMVTKALKRRSTSAKKTATPAVGPKVADPNVSKNLKKQRLLLNSDSSIEGGRSEQAVPEHGNVDVGPSVAVPGDEGSLSDDGGPVDEQDARPDIQIEEVVEDGNDNADGNNDQPVTDVDTDAELASDDDKDEDERMEIDDEVLDGEAINQMFETV